jgi:hypothetical protein
MDLELQLAGTVARAEELERITRELLEASADRHALLESAHAAPAVAPPAPSLAPLPERVEALAAVLEERITELRDAGVDGAVPLVLDDPFASCTPTERAELLGWLEGYSLFLQIIYLADGPDAVAWAEGRNSARVRVVHGEAFFG